MRGPSPFYHRSPITEPAHFHGREREMETLLQRTVGAAKPQCVSVVGNRRIGKSSLFRQLTDHRGPAAAHEGEPVVWVYHDLEGSARLTIDRFFRQVLRRLEKRLAALELDLPPGERPADGEAEEVMSDRIEDLSDEGVRIVLCLDEFDCVTLNEHFDADFFGRLRYLANSFQLAYVTSSFNDLTELCHQDEIRQSPFFNVFSTLNLGLLDEEAARRLLVVESERAGGRLGDEELELIERLAGRHPFHLQQAADAAWTAEPAAGREAVRQRFLEEALPHFRYALEHLPAEAAQALRGCAAGEVGLGETTPGLELLRRRGLVAERDGRLAPFSEEFERWLRARPEATAPSGSADGAPAEPANRLSQAAAMSPTMSSITAPGHAAGARSAPLGEGQTLKGRYRLVESVGRGGFGVVYRAKDELLGRDVAIKCIGWMHHPAGASGQLRARFLQEARAGAGISHPNVVAVHDLIEEGGELHAVMEYFPGRSLRSLLEEHGGLSATDAIGLGAQAARGLQAAHSLGIVHRDVKPENLLVDEEGRLKIVDFGIAFVVEQLRLTTDEGTPMTPRYASPEHVNGEAVGPAADVYSLGTVLFELITGRMLHDAENTSGVLAQVLSVTPSPRLGELDGHGARLAAAVRRCLAHRPAERWPSCEALAEELEACG